MQKWNCIDLKVDRAAIDLAPLIIQAGRCDWPPKLKHWPLNSLIAYKTIHPYHIATINRTAKKRIHLYRNQNEERLNVVSVYLANIRTGTSTSQGYYM